MGQKVNPIGLRLGINQEWRSRWYATKKDYPKLLSEDLKIRDFLKEKLFYSGVSKIEIERAGRLRVIIHTARPGLVIGRKGAEIDKLKEDLAQMTGQGEVVIDIVEVKHPEIDAQLIGENIALQLVRRVSFRRAMKKAVQSALSGGAKGIKVTCSGRLGGAEIARREAYKEGSIPLHTLRALIDYGFAEAHTTYGLIGVKVWVFKGQELVKQTPPKVQAEAGVEKVSVAPVPPSKPLEIKEVKESDHAVDASPS
ncbi:MAG: 30S ribosomal protein S3 [Chlamydiae bacterium]|nr:30S ribosomal protein S3 [Chlamydiota bacterium]MBI3266287.1 30S ribosomal protein S3 [Chlamydiota bacterium]